MDDEWEISLQGVADNVALVKVIIHKWIHERLHEALDPSRPIIVQYFAIDIGIESNGSVLWNDRREEDFVEHSELIVEGSSCWEISDELIQVLLPLFSEVHCVKRKAKKLNF